MFHLYKPINQDDEENDIKSRTKTAKKRMKKFGKEEEEADFQIRKIESRSEKIEPQPLFLFKKMLKTVHH